MTRSPITIGRAPSCDLSIRQRRVSRKHCTLSPVGDGYLLEDHASANGTYIDGRRVQRTFVQTPAVVVVGGERVRLLADGEVVYLCRTTRAETRRGKPVPPPTWMRPFVIAAAWITVALLLWGYWPAVSESTQRGQPGRAAVVVSVESENTTTTAPPGVAPRPTVSRFVLALSEAQVAAAMLTARAQAGSAAPLGIPLGTEPASGVVVSHTDAHTVPHTVALEPPAATARLMQLLSSVLRFSLARGDRIGVRAELERGAHATAERHPSPTLEPRVTVPVPRSLSEAEVVARVAQLLLEGRQQIQRYHVREESVDVLPGTLVALSAFDAIPAGSALAQLWFESERLKNQLEKRVRRLAGRRTVTFGNGNSAVKRRVTKDLAQRLRSLLQKQHSNLRQIQRVLQGALLEVEHSSVRRQLLRLAMASQDASLCRAVFRAARTWRDRETTAALIEGLRTPAYSLRSKIREVLEDITGQRFRRRASWQQWWHEEYTDQTEDGGTP